MKAFWYSTDKTPPSLNLNEIKVVVPSNIRGASKAAFSAVRNLNEKGIFGTLKESKFIFTTLGRRGEEIYNEIKEEFERKLLGYAGFKIDMGMKNELALSPLERFDYFRLIVYGAVRHHAYKKLGSYREKGEIRKVIFPKDGSGIFIVFDSILSHDGRFFAQKGIQMMMEPYFDGRIMCRFDMRTTLVDAESRRKIRTHRLDENHQRWFRGVSMPSPKGRYKYVKERIEKLFDNCESISVKVSDSYSLKFEIVELE